MMSMGCMPQALRTPRLARFSIRASTISEITQIAQ